MRLQSNRCYNHQETDTIITKITDGSLTLTALTEDGSFFQVPVFQIEAVRTWLASERPHYSSLESSGHSRLDPLSVWYLERKNNILGPLSLQEIISLHRHHLLLDSDQIFSPVHRLFAVPKDLQNLEGIQTKKVDFYTNRRNHRTTLECLIKIYNTQTQAAAQALEISAQGLGLYIKCALPLEEVFNIEIDSRESNLKISVMGRIASCIPVLDGYRCGVNFVDLTSETSKALALFLKRPQK